MINKNDYYGLNEIKYFDGDDTYDSDMLGYCRNFDEPCAVCDEEKPIKTKYNLSASQLCKETHKKDVTAERLLLLMKELFKNEQLNSMEKIINRINNLPNTKKTLIYEYIYSIINKCLLYNKKSEKDKIKNEFHSMSLALNVIYKINCD